MFHLSYQGKFYISVDFPQPGVAVTTANICMPADITGIYG